MEERLKKIKAFVLDVDGVLTDGSVFTDLNGEFFRTFNEKDLFALRLASLNGYITGVITGGSSQCIVKGLTKCGIKEDDMFIRSRSKITDFLNFCQKHSLDLDEVMYFGDDLPDAEVIIKSGIGVCPADGCEDIKMIADYISDTPGGRGCVRELIEKTLKLQGRWIYETEAYKEKF